LKNLKVKILSISKNYGRSINGKRGICHESWIYGELENGMKIKIFDMNCEFPEEYAKKTVELLISAMITTEFETSVKIEGEPIYHYEISSRWLNIEPILKEIEYTALKTSNGIFLIGPKDKNLLKLQNTKNISLFVVRFDIIAWYSPE
jgi:hypothetical protein